MYHSKNQGTGESRVELGRQGFGKLFAYVISNALANGLIQTGQYYVVCEHASFFQARHLPQHIVDCLDSPDRCVVSSWMDYVQLVNYNDLRIKVKRLYDGVLVGETAWIHPTSLSFVRESVDRVAMASDTIGAIKRELVKCGGAPILMGQWAWDMLEEQSNLLYRVISPLALERDTYYLTVTKSKVDVERDFFEVATYYLDEQDLGSKCVDGKTLTIYIGYAAALAQRRMDFGYGSINNRYRLHSATGALDWSLTDVYRSDQRNHTELRFG